MKVAWVVGAALMVAGAGSLGYLLTDDADEDRLSTSNTEDPAEDTTQKNTSAKSSRDLANAGAGGTAFTVRALELASSPPENFTGAVIEFAWESTPEPTGLERWDILVAANGETLAHARSSENPIRLTVNASEWKFGGLFVSWGQFGSDDMVVSANGPTEVTVYTTVFTHGPPDWNYTAVE